MCSLADTVATIVGGDVTPLFTKNYHLHMLCEFEYNNTRHWHKTHEAGFPVQYARCCFSCFSCVCVFSIVAGLQRSHARCQVADSRAQMDTERPGRAQCCDHVRLLTNSFPESRVCVCRLLGHDLSGFIDPDKVGSSLDSLTAQCQLLDSQLGVVEAGKLDVKERKRAKLDGDVRLCACVCCVQAVRLGVGESAQARAEGRLWSALQLAGDWRAVPDHSQPGPRRHWQHRSVAFVLALALFFHFCFFCSHSGTFMWLCKEHQQFVQTVQKCVLLLFLCFTLSCCSIVPFTPEYEEFESVKDKIAANIIAPVNGLHFLAVLMSCWLFVEHVLCL